MIRDIVHDILFLQRKAVPAVREDVAVALDLLDTLQAHEAHCVGLAANMIGVAKCIIAINDSGHKLAMLNPAIVKHSAQRYQTREGCLSLAGERETERYASIEVTYRDLGFKKHRQRFAGFTAEIIQHELDHCQGILI
jgi:peptide deformylase